ncbi:MAG: hypothetical protein R3C44_00740 [Chloroflexota bacterium]
MILHRGEAGSRFRRRQLDSDSDGERLLIATSTKPHTHPPAGYAGSIEGPVPYWFDNPLPDDR